MSEATTYSVPVAMWREIRDGYAAVREELRWRSARKPSPAEDSTDPLLVDVCHLTVDNYSEDWPPIDAKGFLTWFEDKLRTVPLIWRKSSTIQIEPEGGYDESSRTEITIWYKREETAEEIADRRARYAQDVALYEKRLQHEAEAEREAFERLKQKFEPSDSGRHPEGEDAAGG